MDETVTVQQNATIDANDTPAQVQTPADPKAAHEAAEAERKAEWETKQAEKKVAQEKKLEEVRTMSAEDVAAAFVKRLDDEAERLTRCKMKTQIAEHIQNMCQANHDFARLTLQPRKKIINCYQWAVDYFGDLDAEEDKDKDDEFVAKPYYGSSSSSRTKKIDPPMKAEPVKQIDLDLGWG